MWTEARKVRSDQDLKLEIINHVEGAKNGSFLSVALVCGISTEAMLEVHIAPLARPAPKDTIEYVSPNHKLSMNVPMSNDSNQDGTEPVVCQPDQAAGGEEGR